MTKPALRYLRCSILLGLVVGAVASCSGGTPTSESTPNDQAASTPAILDAATGVRVLVGGPVEGSSDVLIEGTITVLGGGCLGITLGTNDDLVIWPAGTTVSDEEPLILTTPDGEELQLGERIVASGGFVSPPFPESMPAIPEACGAVDEVAVLDSVEAGEAR